MTAYAPVPAWTAMALCARVDPETWYPEGRGSTYRAARAVCGRCEVAAQCLDYAMAIEAPNHRYGMWGGLSPRHRAKLAQDESVEVAADDGGSDALLTTSEAAAEKEERPTWHGAA